MNRPLFITLLSAGLLCAQSPEDERALIEQALDALPEIGSITDPDPDLLPLTEIDDGPLADEFPPLSPIDERPLSDDLPPFILQQPGSSENSLPLSLRLDSLTLHREVCGLQWKTGSEYVVNSLLQRSALQDTDGRFLFVSGRDTLLITPVFEKGLLMALEMNVRLASNGNAPEPEKLLSALRDILAEDLGSPGKVRITELHPRFADRYGTPMTMYSWIVDEVSVDLVLTRMFESELLLKIKYNDRVEDTDLQSRLRTVFRRE